MKGMRNLVVLFLFVLLATPVNSIAVAGDGDSILKILLKKGVITEAEYKEISEELKVGEREKQLRQNTQIAEAIEYNKPEDKEEGWTDRVRLSGLLEGEYRWMKHRDASGKSSDSISDLYIRRLELGLEAELTDWIKASSVLNSEWIGDSVNGGDEKITVDQAIITLQKEDFPLYLVLGKRVQPFGLFENHLVTDPMTQDAFETKKVGVTIGATGPWGLDVSATLYKGGEQMDHLVESGLFEMTRAGEPSNSLTSYILSVSLSPLTDHLTLFAGYLSEPGRGGRNTTMNLGFSASVPGLKELRFNGEYMKALKREKYAGLDEAFKESIFSVTASYIFNNGDREDQGGRTLWERIAHILEEPIELALRYERLNDDGLAEKTASWSAKNRYSGGVRYPFYRDEEKGLAAFAAVEYRYTDYRLHSSLLDIRADDNKEVFVKLGVAF